MIENKSKACEVFVDGIAHPKEKVLAEEILQGKKVGEFSLDFDQIQVDAMTSRLEGAGCFDEPTPEPTPDEPQDEEGGGDDGENDEGEEEENKDNEEDGEQSPTDPTNEGEPEKPKEGQHQAAGEEQA